MNYQSFKVEDFVIDPYFRRWVLQPDNETNHFWEQWLQANSGKVDKIRKARKILLSLTVIDYQPEPSAEDDVWNAIEESILQCEPAEAKIRPLGPSSIINRYPVKRGKKRSKKLWIYAATSVILLAITAIVYFNHSMISGHIEVENISYSKKSNPKGQKSTIILGDGTKVVLNSESELKYSNQYNLSNRTVWLKGEAFFEVAKDSLKPFIVKTKVSVRQPSYFKVNLIPLTLLYEKT